MGRTVTLAARWRTRFGRHSRSCDNGTAAIEFALMAPFLLVLVGGVVEFGFAMYESMQVNAAVEAGILSAAVNASALASSWNSATVINAVTAANTLPPAYALTATPAPTEFCGCPNVAGSVATLASASPPNCSSGTCSSGNAAGTYVQVNASINHLTLLPTKTVFPGAFTASAVIRIE